MREYEYFVNEFNEGEYISKEKLLKYLEVLDWNMPRRKLIENIKDIPSINITSKEINRKAVEMLLNGELKD